MTVLITGALGWLGKALTEVVGTLGLPLRDNGYRYATPHAEGEVQA